MHSTRLAGLLALALACEAHGPEAASTTGTTGTTDPSGPDPELETTDTTDTSGPDPELETTGTTAPTTSTTADPPLPLELWLPLACGVTARVGQGNASDFSHTGDARYAFDILLALDTPVHAMAAGTVLHVYDANEPGDPCHDGGDESCFALANLVVVLHDDGTTTLYKHLERVLVVEGAHVERGAVLGRSGSTGWSTTPHLHVMRMGLCDDLQCPSIPMRFADVPGDGVPVTGQLVTSMSCPA